MIEHVLTAARPVPFDGHFVVTQDPDPKADLARSHGFEIIPIQERDPGQGDSIRIGVTYLLNAGYEGVCILLGDMPFVTQNYLEELLSAASDHTAIFSRAQDRLQPPAIIKMPALYSLTVLRGDEGFLRRFGEADMMLGELALPAEMARDIDRLEDLSDNS